MSTPRPTVIANQDGISAEAILSSFAIWIDSRLSEAMKACRDLAFRDRPFDLDPSRSPVLLGWDYVLLEPGRDPPCGPAWTIYRLQAQPEIQPDPLPRLGRDSAFHALLEAAGGFGPAPSGPIPPLEPDPLRWNRFAIPPMR